MFFNGSGCYFLLLLNYFSNFGFGIIQFNFKFELRIGVIIVFQFIMLLIVYLNNMVCIQWGLLYIDFNLYVILKKWYQFVLLYDVLLRLFIIYVLLDYEVVWWILIIVLEVVLKQIGIFRIVEWKDNVLF